MANTDETKITAPDPLQPEVGKSDLVEIDQPEIAVEGEPKVAEDKAKEEVEIYEPTGLDDDKLYTDSDKATASKAEATFTTGNDFYDEFLQKQEQAAFVKDMQSADTYWNNRPEERKKYEAQYGDKAREAFDADYQKVEDVWRNKLDNETDKATMNERFDWIFGHGDNVNYDMAPVFELTTKIHNGARRIGNLLTDKEKSDREAAIDAKTYINDKGELVTLGDNEKWYSFSKGYGVEMNANDPKHKSSDGRKIVGFEYVQFGPEDRLVPYLKAIYQGDTPKGEVVSMWDTTNSWLMKSNGKKAGGPVKMLAHTTVRTVTNLAADMITGTTAILGSVATLLDKDDHNAFIDSMNDTSSAIKARRMSISEYDQQHTVTWSNALDFTAQVATQLYMAAGLAKGANALTKMFLAKNPVLVEARALEKAGKFAEAGKKYYQFEATHGLAGRSASLLGLTLATGDSFVQSSRNAGFSEDETAANYIAYFGVMMAANTISNRMIEPYLTDASAKPIMNDIIKQSTPLFKDATTDKAKISVARSMINKMSDAVSGLKKLPTLAGHTPTSAKIRSIMYSGLNEAIEEEAEFIGQAAVETMATMLARYRHKGEKQIPKFDTLFDDGYWARQLPNIVMSGLGGFMGGAATHFLPGMAHQNEDSYLIKGDDKSRLLRIAMAGGENEARFLKQLERQKKNGALGSDLLSIKINEQTGKFYKMTDPEAKDTISHAEAAHRAIMHQYLTYKSLYGGASKSYEDILKTEPKLAAELANATDHVLYSELEKLHDEKIALLKVLSPGITDMGSVTDTKDKKESSKKVEKAEEKAAEPVDLDKPGVTKEPEDQEKVQEKEKEIAKTFAKRVEDRANLLGTTNMIGVEKLLQVEDRIDDILSGKAAVQQVIHSVARNKNITPFIGDEQKKYFEKVVNDKGDEIDSPYSNFGDNLIETLFSADTNLAAGHASRHAEYIKNAEVLNNLINSNFTAEDIKRLAAQAAAKPHSVPIDKDTMQLETLREGVNKLLNGLISPSEFELIVSSARTSLGLTMSTEEYMTAIEDKVFDAIDNNELFALSTEEVEQFIDRNLDLIHAASKSVFLDNLAKTPTKFITAGINLDKLAFRDRLIEGLQNVPGGLSLDPAVEGEAEAKIATLTSMLEGFRKSLETLTKQIPKTNAERVAQEREADSLRKQIAAKQTELDNAIKASAYEGSFGMVLPKIGAEAIAGLSKSGFGELTPVVKINSEALTSARGLLTDFNTIIQNIAPVIPSVPKLGAVYNLLNEISTDGTTIQATLNKIISDSDETASITHLPDGRVIRTEAVPSLIEELENTIINEKSENPEFRNLESAKSLLNMINIRMAQARLIKESLPFLTKLQIYSRQHMTAGNNKYDRLPRFLSEYMYDPERYEFLAKKAIRTKEEDEDLHEIIVRHELLTNFDLPQSVYARLKEAKERVERLVDLGIKSLDMNERYRVYVSEVAKNLTLVKNGFNSNSTAIQILRSASPELDAAILKFSNVKDAFLESDQEGLIAGKAALDEVLKLVYTLPDAAKAKFLQDVQSFAHASLYPKDVVLDLLINSMATSSDQFEYYYKNVLSGQQGLVSPTIAQENMIRTAFSFLTDRTGAFKKLGNNETPEAFFIDGKNGTGKSTMVGYGIAAAQQYMDEIVKSSPNYEAGKVYNNVIFAAPYEHQAINIRDLAVKCGVRASGAVQPLTKTELYRFLDSSATLNDISIIVFDEATFIQGKAAEGQDQSELDWFVNKVRTLNKTRADKGLVPLKLLLVGDDGQGGYHDGMPRMFDQVPNALTDYKKIGDRNFVTKVVDHSRSLTYPFRTLCSKVSEISDQIRNIRGDLFSALDGESKKTSEVKVSYGVIGNDSKKRMGGVQVVQNATQLYADNDLVENIKKQIAENPKFSVLIVDDQRSKLEDLPIEAEALKKLIAEHPMNFTFRNTETVQGGEADYVIANTNSIFPTLPISDVAAVAKLGRLSMVISRARFFSKVTADRDVNVKTIANAVISVLPEEEANALTNKWNEFYLTKYRTVTDKVKPIEEVVKPAEAANETAPVQEEETETATTVTAPTVEEKPVETEPVNTDTGSLSMQDTMVNPTLTIPLPIESIITPDKFDVIVEENKAAATSTEETEEAKKAKAEAIKRVQDAQAKVLQTVDVFGDPVVGSFAENIIPESEDDTKLTREEKSAKELINLEQNLGIILSYTKVAQGSSIQAQDAMRLNFGSDLFGPPSKYKSKEERASAMTTIKETMADILNMDKSDKSILDRYHFTLVSFQTHYRQKGTDVVVHQLYAQKRTPGSIKVPVLMFPTTSFTPNSKFRQFLEAREKLVEDSQEAMRALYNNSTTKPIFTEQKLGRSGVSFSDENVALLNINLANIMPSDHFVFPKSGKSRFGRVGLSDNHPDDPYMKWKIEERNRNIGLMYYETKIDDIHKVFKAVTAGRPLKSSAESKKKYVGLYPNRAKYLNSLPLEGGIYWDSEVVNDLKKYFNLSPKEVLKGEKLTVEALDSIRPHLVLYDGHPIMKLGGYLVITFKGTNGRNISVVSQGGPFKLTFGFDPQGKPIIPDPKINRDITEDMEAETLIRALGKNNIKTDDVLEVKSADEANARLGANHGYTVESLKGLDKESMLELMSSQFMDGKITPFSDLQISLGDFKTLVETDGVQISDALTVTKTTVGDHQGKSFVLYTYRPKSKIDLSNTKTLNQLLSRFTIDKRFKIENPSPADIKKFNAEVFARYGVGVVMLDSKMQSFAGLLRRYRNKDAKDMNRASSPVKSKANQRMVSFVKELTLIVHEIYGKTRGGQIAQGLHNLLPKMGMSEDGKTPLVQIFDDASKAKLTEMLTLLAQDPKEKVTFDALQDMLTAITSDVKLGFQARNIDNVPEIVKNFLEITDPKERVDFWETYFEGKVLSKDVNDALSSLKISKSNLWGQTFVQDGKIAGKIIIDSESGRPLIVNHERNAITFINPDLVPGSQAVFNMAFFIERLSRIEPTTGEKVASLLDKIMRGYSASGTLRKGIMWTGRLSTHLNSGLVAKVEKSDAKDMFVTSVKEINPPAIMVDAKALMSDVETKPEPKKVAEISKEDDEISIDQERAQCTEKWKKMILSKSLMMDFNKSREEILADKNIAVQNIAQEISAEEALFDPKEFTRIKNELLKEFSSLVESKMPSKQEDRDLKEREQIKKQIIPLETPTPQDLVLDFTSDIAHIIANNVDGKKSNSFQVLLDQINQIDTSHFDEAQKASWDSDKQILIDRINEHLQMLNEEPDVLPLGEQMMAAFNKHENFSKKATPAQKDAVQKLANAIDADKLPLTERQKSMIPNMITILTDPEGFSQLDPETQETVQTRGSAIQIQLMFFAGDPKGALKFSVQQMADLQKAFRILRAVC